jgi:hypothetical protein
MTRGIGSPMSVLVQWDLAGAIIRQSTFLDSYRILDIDASPGFLYALHTPGADDQHSSLLKIDRAAWTIVGTTELPGGEFNAISVLDDGEIYAVRKTTNEGPATFHRLDWSGAAATIATVGATDVFILNGFDAQLIFSNGVAYYGNGRGPMYRIALTMSEEGVQLMVPVGQACRIAGLPESRFDVSELTDLVRGYARDRQMTMRDFIYPLMPHYFFDAVESGGGRCPRRSRSPSLPLTRTAPRCRTRSTARRSTSASSRRSSRSNTCRRTRTTSAACSKTSASSAIFGTSSSSICRSR